MAWKVPKHRFVTGSVADAVALNENALQFVEELGHLNEHNWSNTLGTGLSFITGSEEDIAWRIGRSQQEADIGGPISVDVFDLDPTELWVAVDDAVTTIRTDGAPLYIIFTGQYAQDAADADVYLGATFGIEIDGNLIAESVSGVLDTTSGGDGAEIGYAGDSHGFDCEITVPVLPGEHVVRGMARLSRRSSSRLDAPETAAVGAIIGHRELITWELGR